MITTKKCDILLKNGLYLTEQYNVESFHTIAICDKHIISIQSSADPKTKWAAETTLDCDGKLVMPGLADGHIHTSQQLLRGRLLDEKPVIWKRINVPFESKLTEETSALSAKLAALEMIHHGTTAFVDAGGHFPEIFAQVYDTSGLRGALTYMTNDSPYAPDSLRTMPNDALKILTNLHKQLSGRLKGYFSVTALTAASQDMIHAVFSEAKTHGIPVTTHMNEYASEVFDFIEMYGTRPFQYLEQENLLPSQMVAAHCIFLSEEEKEIIKKHNISVVHCPFSNCGKGIPETPALLNKGISVSFGTDGSAHGGLDLFREMRLFRGVMNASHGIGTANPQIMPARTLLKMAFGNNSNILTEPGLGQITQNTLADLIILDIMAPHLYPTANLVHSLVESADGHDVVHMIVDGQLIMKNREIQTLDEEAILHEVKNV